MERQDSTCASRAEVLLVVGLLLIAVVAWAALILYQQGIWFGPATAAILYPVLWTILWLPGIAMFSVLFVRKKRLAFAAGLILQGIAIGLYWWSTHHLNQSGTLALAGLSLPYLARPPGETSRQKSAAVLLILVVLALAYLAHGWVHSALFALFLYIPYAATFWPAVGEAFHKCVRQEDEWRRTSRAYRWLDLLATAFAVLFAFCAAVKGRMRVRRQEWMFRRPARARW